MKLHHRLVRLEASVRPGKCAVCHAAGVGVLYDPPLEPGEPSPLVGRPIPSVPCAACGRTPRIVIKTRRPT